jgi:ParB family transcriptional regulator, chromosome partitioning protein
MLLESHVRTDEITRVNSVLTELARGLNCTRSEAGKSVRRLHNEKRGLVKVKTGPTRARQIIGIVNAGGWTLREFVHRKLPLLELPDDLKDLVKRGLLEPTKALELRKIEDEESRKARAFEVIGKRISLREMRQVSPAPPGSPVMASDSSLDTDLRQISLEASRQLGTRVVITRGEVRISWVDGDGLNGLLERLGITY